MEIYAGYLAQTDYEVGRLVDAIKELGVFDNTLFIYIVGDNGASGEGVIAALLISHETGGAWVTAGVRQERERFSVLRKIAYSGWRAPY